MPRSVLLGGYLVFWTAMGVAPLDRASWTLFSILPLALVGTLLLGQRVLTLSRASYAMIIGFLVLHTIGAYYTYAQMPIGLWLQQALALERNHFDRIVHFAFGLLFTYPLFEAAGRFTGAGRHLLYYLVLMTQLGLAGAWEVIEFAVANLTRPELGTAFLGSQGDVWDAQRDMIAAIGGTAVALLLTAGWRWRSGHSLKSRAKAVLPAS